MTRKKKHGAAFYNALRKIMLLIYIKIVFCNVNIQLFYSFCVSHFVKLMLANFEKEARSLAIKWQLFCVTLGDIGRWSTPENYEADELPTVLNNLSPVLSTIGFRTREM